MATRKPGTGRSLLESISETAAKFERDSPVLATRWSVVEITDRWTDEYDSDHGGTERVVSPYYDTKEEAQTFINEHDPAKFTTFGIRYENLREYKYKRWGA